jgi:hypothetical protein
VAEKSTATVAEPSELFRLKCASHHYSVDMDSTHFKRNNPLVCRVSARYNYGSNGLKQVYLARRRVYNHSTAHQLLIYRNINIVTNLYSTQHKFIPPVFKMTSYTACPGSQRKKSKLVTTHVAMVGTMLSSKSSITRRVTASWGWIPLHGLAVRNRSWPGETIRGVLEGYT